MRPLDETSKRAGQRRRVAQRLIHLRILVGAIMKSCFDTFLGGSDVAKATAAGFAVVRA